jgi:hypothetical protein
MLLSILFTILPEIIALLDASMSLLQDLLNLEIEAVLNATLPCSTFKVASILYTPIVEAQE